MSIIRKAKDEKEAEKIEKFILDSTVNDLFSFLYHKLLTSDGKPVTMGIMWQDVMFTIECENVENMETSKKAFFNEM